MAFAPSLALDPTFGIHFHKTLGLDTAQPCHLFKSQTENLPLLTRSHSISILTNISTQFLLQSLCVCVFVVHLKKKKLYVNCFGRTMLYMCIEYHI